MTHETLQRAVAGDPEAFRELTSPYRNELLAHCYRIVGSVADAEDVLQETMMAAWRGLNRYEGRGSVRGWLYRIATNRALNHLRALDRRPSRADTPPDLPHPTRMTQPSWIQPYPDTLLEGLPDQAPGPEARYEATEAISLAFVIALQALPPRQRATLLLRDVLGLRAREVAEILACTEDAITSMLTRARATIKAVTPDRERASAPDSPAQRALAARFAEAYQHGDMTTMVTLLTEDVRLTMPPAPLEYQGRLVVTQFLRTVCQVPGAPSPRLVATRANGQAAFGYYLPDQHTDIAHAHGLLVLTTNPTRITAITRFLDNSCLPYFGLPRTLPQ